jgi:hypothetical protein
MFILPEISKLIGWLLYYGMGVKYLSTPKYPAIPKLDVWNQVDEGREENRARYEK